MKIAIIGAGPAGLYGALAAAKKGLQVDLYDKRRVGEGIVCGECIFDSLRIMPKPGAGLLRSVDEVIFQGHHPYPFALSRHRPLWMLDRKTWQEDLARAARSLGVTLIENTKITPSRLGEMQKLYDGMIDASGAPSVTSRLYGFSGEYLKEALVAYQCVLQSDFSAIWPKIFIAFLPGLPARHQPAYAWIFPKDQHMANVGVVYTLREEDKKESPDLKIFLMNFMKTHGLFTAKILEQGGGLATGRVLPSLVYDNILLAGDAAGLTSPLHGGGIDLACLSGVLAADALAAGSSAVAGYDALVRNYLRERTALEQVTIRKMRKMNFDQFDRLLSGVTAKSKWTRLKTGLRHPDMLYTTLKWFGVKKKIPDWPV